MLRHLHTLLKRHDHGGAALPSVEVGIANAVVGALRAHGDAGGRPEGGTGLDPALDISAFVMGGGQPIDVLTNWGPTARDRQAQAKSEKPAGGGDARPIRDAEQVDGTSTSKARFLRRMHASACSMFGTVLGPEANEAHRDHLHLDLAPRKHSAFCE